MTRDRRLRVLELRSVRGTGGGPEKTILLGAAQADRDAVEVTVAYIRDRRDETFGTHQRAADLGVEYVEILERHSFDVNVWAQLKRVVRDRQIDIVHAHEYKTDFLAWLLSRRTRAIPLATAHGWTGHSARERVLYYPADKRLLARFPRVIAVSTDIKDELVRCGADPDRVEVVLNAIDPSAFRSVAECRPRVRQALGLTDQDFVIGAVGRLERQKRFDVLLDVFAQVTHTHPRCHLVVVGDGSLRTELTSLANALGIEGSCHLLGHREDVPQLYQAFDLFVQSSEYEGTPNTVLEAMATETPLVATDVGGTRELARPGIDGLIVPPHDPAALRHAIDSVLADPAAARARAISARERVRSELSFTARTRHLENLYQKLASESGLTRATVNPSESIQR